jgi:hypothetical protein
VVDSSEEEVEEGDYDDEEVTPEKKGKSKPLAKVNPSPNTNEYVVMPTNTPTND